MRARTVVNTSGTVDTAFLYVYKEEYTQVTHTHKDI